MNKSFQKLISKKKKLKKSEMCIEGRKVKIEKSSPWLGKDIGTK